MRVVPPVNGRSMLLRVANKFFNLHPGRGVAKEKEIVTMLTRRPIF